MNIEIAYLGTNPQTRNTTFDCVACRNAAKCRANDYQNNCAFYDAMRPHFRMFYMTPDFQTNQPLDLRINIDWSYLKPDETVSAALNRAEKIVAMVRQGMKQNTK